MKSNLFLEGDKVVAKSFETLTSYEVKRPYRSFAHQDGWVNVSGKYNLKYIKSLEKKGLIEWY